VVDQGKIPDELLAAFGLGAGAKRSAKTVRSNKTATNKSSSRTSVVDEPVDDAPLDGEDDAAESPEAARAALSDSELVAAANEAIDQRLVHTVFQPLVHLPTSEVVGYEALSRGPVGTPVESPLLLLQGASLAGRLSELDWLCAAAACQAVVEAHLHPSMTIFLNLEPSTLLKPCPPDLLELTRRARNRLRIVIETKERSLMDNPLELFDALNQVRESGWGVALDDAAASPSSLALMPLVSPDVIKMNVGGLRHRLDDLAQMGDGARIYAEQSGAPILAQGIESAEDLPAARLAGALYGQGWHFGRPGPLPTSSAVPRSIFPMLPKPNMSSDATPFQIISEVQPYAIAEKRYLSALGHYLEDQADANGPRALLLISYQLNHRVSEDDRVRLTRLINRSAFTAILGPTMAPFDSSNVRATKIRAGDSLAREWNVIVLGSHYAGALAARDLRDSGPEDERRYEYVITHDRDLILASARSLLRRIGQRPNSSR
jgi:EAL domain-containing protein (putative c-di-GMP-specific phosphodiesterase class I)